MKNVIPRSVQKAIDELAKLPGIGPKTAGRLVFYLLSRPETETKGLGSSLLELQENLLRCSQCFNITEVDPCPICSDSSRDLTILAVVEEPLDIISMEKAQFAGHYHVLGGAISPINGIGPGELRIDELMVRIKNDSPIREIILATNPTLEGEATAMYIDREIAKLNSSKKLKVTRIARGLPIGGDLEYADELTVSRALEGRREY